MHSRTKLQCSVYCAQCTVQYTVYCAVHSVLCTARCTVQCSVLFRNYNSTWEGAMSSNRTVLYDLRKDPEEQDDLSQDPSFQEVT